MRMKRFVFFAACLFVAQTLFAQSKSGVERSTDVLCLLPSATGFVAALAQNDKEGIKELAFSSAAVLALNYGLEAVIRKDRPDGTGHHSFPSTHTAVAFNGASFLLKRYGWKWGVPAYAVSSYVAWGRVHAKRHDVWDVLGGAALGAGSALLLTHPFTKSGDLSIAPATFGQDSYGVHLALSF